MSKQTMEQIFKQAMDGKGKAPAVYVQIHVEGTDKAISEKVDGMMGVMFSDKGNKREIQAVMAVPPSVDQVKDGFASLVQALTLMLYNSTSADMDDIHNLLHGAVSKGMANAMITMVGEQDPAQAKKLSQMQELLDLLERMKG